MKRAFLALVVLSLLTGADCGSTLRTCPEGTAIPSFNFENGSRECIPFDDICITQNGNSTIACADCPACDPYQPPDGDEPPPDAGMGDGSVGDVCESCSTDDDCGPDLACVPMLFEDAPRPTGYCLYRADRGVCEQPFALVLPEPRQSLSGAEATQYCGIDERLTTCEAVLALIDDVECATDTDCPQGGICREVGALGLQCTYECAGAGACPEEPAAGSGCGDANGTSEEDYCGG